MMNKKRGSDANRWDVTRVAATAGWGATLRVCLIIICFGLASSAVLAAVAGIISELLATH
jgi:hypothetical protein